MAMPVEAQAEIGEGDRAGDDDAEIAEGCADRVAQAGVEVGRRQEGPCSSQRCTTRVDREAARRRSAPAMTIVDSEIVTSPTLNAEKAARTEDRRSADSTPQGASASRIAAMDRAARGRRRRPGRAICSSERRRRPVLAWSAVATRVWPRSVPPTSSSDEPDGEEQQRRESADPDDLVDQEGRRARRSRRARRATTAIAAAQPRMRAGPAQASPSGRRGRGIPRPRSPPRRSGAGRRREASAAASANRPRVATVIGSAAAMAWLRLSTTLPAATTAPKRDHEAAVRAPRPPPSTATRRQAERPGARMAWARAREEGDEGEAAQRRREQAEGGAAAARP